MFRKIWSFLLLSKEFPELIDIIGYHGIVIEPLPVDEIVLKRIIERGKKFYKLFGWSSEKNLKNVQKLLLQVKLL